MIGPIIEECRNYGIRLETFEGRLSVLMPVGGPALDEIPGLRARLRVHAEKLLESNLLRDVALPPDGNLLASWQKQTRRLIEAGYSEDEAREFAALQIGFDLEGWEERAAIMEFDGGLSRSDAERNSPPAKVSSRLEPSHHGPVP